MKLNKIIPTIKIIICIISLFLICFCTYNIGKDKAYSRQYDYYKKTKALLDSINSWDSSFMDTVMESDVYYEYKLSYDKIPKITK